MANLEGTFQFANVMIWRCFSFIVYNENNYFSSHAQGKT